MACRGKVIVAMHLETIPTNYEWYVKKFYKGFFFFCIATTSYLFL